MKKGDPVVAVRDPVHPRSLYAKGDMGVVITEIAVDPQSPVEGMTQVYVYRTGKYVWIYNSNWRKVDVAPDER